MRWHPLCLCRSKVVVLVAAALSTVYLMRYTEYKVPQKYGRLKSMGPQDRNKTGRYIEILLKEALLLDKGSGCSLPELDPFAAEVTQFDQHVPRIRCPGQDWVQCYHSKCRVVEAIRANVSELLCEYRDILYHNDRNYTIGSPTKVVGADEYQLVASDHVVVACIGRERHGAVKWSGIKLGFRPVPPTPPPAGREDTFNVLLFAFDSTSRNGFIRLMPKSWRMLKKLGFTVMEGYNIVGDGTMSALFPILMGKTELELPDVRKSIHNNATMDSFPFIFHKLKQDGYRTAYFEDNPNMGTFQLRHNGFTRQPTDHYWRAFFKEREKMYPRSFCVGDTPQYRLMMNTTRQFMELDGIGKRFLFTFISDITHDNFRLLQWADDDMAAFLRSAMRWVDDTLIVVFGDHGPRYSRLRATYQGKLEERLPLLAIRLPSRLTLSRWAAQRALEQNARALTTPHDLHATILDVVRMREHQNPYKVPGADMKRGLSMLEPIPRNRSCSEAGIEPHWCACLKWQNVSNDDPFYQRTGETLIDYINSLFDSEVRSLCVPRTLTSIEWVLRHRPHNKLLAYGGPLDYDKYTGTFNGITKMANENYQVKIVAGPGRSLFEASMTYLAKEDEFFLSTRAISRTNAYGKEPACITAQHPHLNPYCYCR